MKGWDLNNTHVHSMGFEKDPDRYLMFIDGYGSARNRVVEPSVTGRKSTRFFFYLTKNR